jgi:uncharacterized membrane protein YfcA
METKLAVMAILLGVLTGFINTLAGSGSILILPFLIFAGLGADVANATNRIGLFLQTLVSTATLQSRSALPMQGSGVLIWPSVGGAIIGSLLALHMTAEIMHWVIGILMVLLIVPVAMNPTKWLSTQDHRQHPRRPWLVGSLAFFLGIYGGFIQAGVGIFLLALMVQVANFSITRANMLKNLIVCVFTIPVLIIFIYYDKVNWQFGLTLAIGQVAGGWTAARFLARHELAGKITRILVIVMLLASAVSMFLKA